MTKAASAQPGTRTKVEPVCPAGGGHRLSITRVRRTAGTPGARVTPSHWRADGKSGQEGAWGGAGFPARRSVPGLWPEAWELGSLGPHPAEWLAGTVGQPVRVLPLMGRPVVLNALPARPTLERHPLRTGVAGGGKQARSGGRARWGGGLAQSCPGQACGNKRTLLAPRDSGMDTLGDRCWGARCRPGRAFLSLRTDMAPLDSDPELPW